MKRFLAILLAAAMLFLTACTGSSSLLNTGEEETATFSATKAENGESAKQDGAHDAAGFSAGFGRQDITPGNSVPLAGYGNTEFRLSTNVLDPLYATCLALRDESGETLILFQFDLINSVKTFSDQVRKMVSKALDVEEDHILINMTHTHSGPDLNSQAGSIGAWKTKAYQGALQAAKDAVLDLDQCEHIYVGATETDRLNFVRRYYRENGFTTDNADYGTGNIVGHETEADQEMRLVKFERKNQKDIVLANWQCHPHRTGGSSKTDISSDIIGTMRKNTEKELGVDFIFFQGGAGNINPVSRIEGEARFGDYKDIGRALYEHLATGLTGSMRETSPGSIRAEQVTIIGTYNHEDEDLVEKCREIAAAWSANNKTEASALCAKYGISSSFEASAIINRVSRPETGEIPLYCYAFGDVAIASAPFEMFCQTEKQLREDSPFGFTLTCGYSNDSQGYMPAAESFPNKGYEVVTCHYVQGTAEQISAKQLEMLNELYAK